MKLEHVVVLGAVQSVMLACAPEPAVGLNHCHGFVLTSIDETTPFDALATQDISLLNELNERYDDRCAFGDVVVNCFVGATSDEDCRVLADEAVAFVSTRGRVVEARCDFTCEIE